MKIYYRLYYFIFLSALGLYLVGLFLPYTTIQCIGVDDQTSIGMENKIALSGLILIIPLIVLAFVKHSFISNWSSILLSAFLFFLPILFLFWFPTDLLADCEETEEIGQKILSYSSTLFFVAAIAKRRIPVDTTATTKNDSSTDIIDNL